MDPHLCVGAHHLSRKLKTLGHDARLMPAKYVRPYSKGQKNDFRDAEAIRPAGPASRAQFAQQTTACCISWLNSRHDRRGGGTFSMSKLSHRWLSANNPTLALIAPRSTY
jgi:hypothetical protein